MVGATGFEPATSSPPVKRATKLRYAPTIALRPARFARDLFFGKKFSGVTQESACDLDGFAIFEPWGHGDSVDG